MVTCIDLSFKKKIIYMLKIIKFKDENIWRWRWKGGEWKKGEKIKEKKKLDKNLGLRGV